MTSPFKISASRLKTFQTCSWLYHCKYLLKLPDSTNTGALMGNLCHVIFECLLNERHKKLYDSVLAAPASITNSPAIERHVKRYMEKYNLPEELFDKIDTMILVGLTTDFFCKGGRLLAPELKFSLVSEAPKYIITGFMDKPAVYKDKDGAEKFVRIADYKSSKKKFEGDELKINVQAMMYSLAAKKLWPELIPVVDFIFLQFPKDPIQRLKFSDSQLKGFESFLSSVFKQMASFDAEKAVSNLAAKQKLPGSGQGFKGPLVCGWAGKKGFVKTPDQKKANGDPAYHCAFMFPFQYYALCDADGNVLRSSFDNDLKLDEAKGQFVIKKTYRGCPAFAKRRI